MGLHLKVVLLGLVFASLFSIVIFIPHTAFSQTPGTGADEVKIPPKVSKNWEDYPTRDTGASFVVKKYVFGGDATPDQFSFNVILTGPSGTATYSLGHTVGQGTPGETDPFNLNLPSGNTLSEGSFQIVETNPGNYVPTYSKGCSGTYDNNGYYYVCVITNTEKTTTNTVPAVTRTGPLPPQPGIPSKTNSTTVGSNTGKTSTPTLNTGKTLPTLPSKVTTPSTGKTTLPTIPKVTTPITGKTTLPTVPKTTTPSIGKNPTPTTGKITLPPTTSKPVTTCPAGTILVSGHCVLKGKVVGATQ